MIRRRFNDMKKMPQNDAMLEIKAKKLAKKRDREKIVLPDRESFFKNKKNIVKLILFFLFFAVAVFFITRAVWLIVHKEPGWYTIDADADENVPYYSSGIEFKYCMTGSSNEITIKLKEVKSAYENSLKTVYKLTDPVNKYENVSNIASINQKRGEDVKISDELFSILSEASDSKGEGYSPTDGVFVHIRDSLIYSEEHNRESEEAFSSMISDLRDVPDGGVTLTLDEKNGTARLDVTPEMKAFLDKYELNDCPLLDLGALRRAFILRYVADEMEKQGYRNGNLTSDDGLSVLLSENEESGVCLYSKIVTDEGSKGVVSAVRTCRGGSASASFRIFGLYDEEYGFYSYNDGDKTVYRHKYESSGSGDPCVYSILASDDGGDVVKAAAHALMLLSQSDPERVAELASSENDLNVVFETVGEPKVLYTTSAEGVAFSSDEGFVLRAYK